jgi:hypothetical protein
VEIPSLVQRREQQAVAFDADELLDDLASQRGRRLSRTTPVVADGAHVEFESTHPAGRSVTPAASGPSSASSSSTSSNSNESEFAPVVDLGRWNPKRSRGRGPAAAVNPTKDEQPRLDLGPVDGEPVTATQAIRTAKKRGRTGVPSWDEIVFGTRSED